MNCPNKLKEAVDVVNKKCLTLNCGIHVQNKYKGYCLRCFIYTFPNEQISRNYKTKETLSRVDQQL